MSSEVKVCRIADSEWDTYRTTRLAALRESPSAFGSTLELALSLSETDWQHRISNASATLDFPVFAKSSEEVIGLAWGKIHEESASTAHLFQMWVAPAARGRGAGTKLLNAVVNWAKEQHVARLLLSVTIDDSAAWRMYKSAGFQEFGAPEPLREGSDVMSQPMVLEFQTYA